MKIKFVFILFCILSMACTAFEVLRVSEEYIFEVYHSDDFIPSEVLNEGLEMYYEAYLYPKLHENIPLSQLKIDENKFSSYDEFIADMFARDFESYQRPGSPRRIYLQARRITDGKVVGVCAVLAGQNPGDYYIDHIGTHKDFRRQGIATDLLNLFIQMAGEFNEIALDTRVFNWPAQALYDHLGFTKIAIHPNPNKQTTYFHYVLRGRTRKTIIGNDWGQANTGWKAFIYTNLKPLIF